MVRWIKLKEFDQGVDPTLMPSDAYMANCDGSLPQEETRILVDQDGFMRSGAEALGEERIVLLGDSSAESLWMQSGQRLGAVIETQLREQGRRVDVLMNAMSNCTTLHAVNIFLNKCIPLRPTQLIYMSCGSDAEALCSPNQYWLRDPGQQLSPLTQYEEGSDMPDKPAPEVAARWSMLHVLREAAAAHGTELVLVTAPYRNRIDAYLRDYYKNEFGYHETISGWKSQINACTRQFAAQSGTRLVDAEGFSQEEGIFYDIVHLNAAGCERVGRFIADRLAPLAPAQLQEQAEPLASPLVGLYRRILDRAQARARPQLGWGAR